MGKYSLIAADGCEFNIARNPQDPSIPNSITNLPSDKFSLEQIKHIYHLHWDRKLLSAT